MSKLRCFNSLLLAIIFLQEHSLASEDLPQSFTIDGRLYSDSQATIPLVGIVALKLQILNPAQNCILYEETQSVDTTTSSGYYTIQVGQKAGPPAGKRTSADSNNAMSSLLSNTTAAISGKLLTDGTTACSYTPTVGESRYIKFTMTPASDNIARSTTTNLRVDSVPMALVAERAENLRGYTPSSFLQVNSTTSALTQSNLESIFSTTGVSRLSSLISVPPTNYVQATTNGSAGIPSVAADPAVGLAAGQMWYNSTSNTLKYYDAGSASVKDVASSSGGSYLPLAGGTLTGNLVAPNLLGATAANGNLTIESTSNATKGNILLAPNGGNVGVGTSSPSAQLDIYGTPVSSASNLSNVLSVVGAFNTGNGAGAGVSITTGRKGCCSTGAVFTMGGGAYAGGGAITLSAGLNGGGGPGAINILGAGAVGSSDQTGGPINIVGGNASGNYNGGPLNLTGGSGGSAAAAGNGANVVINGGAALGTGTHGNVLLADSRGKVGIGTTNPGEALTVAGTIESTSGGVKFPDGSTQTTANTVQGSLTNGRLTLTSVTPLTTSDVTGASSVYLTPFRGNRIALYNGTTWREYTFTEKSIALSGLTSGKAYDVFAYIKAGAFAIDLGPAWTNDSTRALSLTLQDGVYANSATFTSTILGDSVITTQGKYIGTIYTTGATTTEDSQANAYIWNYYNRIARPFRKTDSTQHTINNVPGREWNGNTATRANFIIGIVEDAVRARIFTRAACTGGSNVFVYVRINGVSSNFSTFNPSASGNVGLERVQEFYPQVGHNHVAVGEGEFASANCFLDWGASEGSIWR